MNDVQVNLGPLAFDDLASARDEVTKRTTIRIAAGVRKVTTRFVTWIDNVDVDGQEYWS